MYRLSSRSSSACVRAWIVVRDSTRNFHYSIRKFQVQRHPGTKVVLPPTRTPLNSRNTSLAHTRLLPGSARLLAALPVGPLEVVTPPSRLLVLDLTTNTANQRVNLRVNFSRAALLLLAIHAPVTGHLAGGRRLYSSSESVSFCSRNQLQNPQ